MTTLDTPKFEPYCQLDRDKIERLRSINAELLSALEAIAGMRVTETTDDAQLCALCISVAQAAVTKANP